MATINPIQRAPQKDPLEDISKALQIAAGVYGIYDAGQKRDLMQQEMETKNKHLQVESQRYKAQEARDSARLGIEQDRLNNDKRKTDIEEKKQSDDARRGKVVPAGEAVALGSANASFQTLENVKKLYESNKDISGPLQGWVSKAQGIGEFGEDGKKFKSYDSQLNAAAQVIGKYLEGGKLTDADIDRYKKILPNNLDSPEVAEKKAIVLQNMIAQKQESETKALKQAGYNVENIETAPFHKRPNIDAPPRTNMPPFEPDYLAAVQEKARRDAIREQGIAGTLKIKGK